MNTCNIHVYAVLMYAYLDTGEYGKYSLARSSGPLLYLL